MTHGAPSSPPKRAARRRSYAISQGGEELLQHRDLGVVRALRAASRGQRGAVRVDTFSKARGGGGRWLENGGHSESISGVPLDGRCTAFTNTVNGNKDRKATVNNKPRGNLYYFVEAPQPSTADIGFAKYRTVSRAWLRAGRPCTHCLHAATTGVRYSCETSSKQL